MFHLIGYQIEKGKLNHNKNVEVIQPYVLVPQAFSKRIRWFMNALADVCSESPYLANFTIVLRVSVTWSVVLIGPPL